MKIVQIKYIIWMCVNYAKKLACSLRSPVRNRRILRAATICAGLTWGSLVHGNPAETSPTTQLGKRTRNHGNGIKTPSHTDSTVADRFNGTDSLFLVRLPVHINSFH